MDLSDAERIVYDAICQAAEAGRVCPDHLDLNMLIGYESTSSSPTIVARLEKRGLIVVERFQRFRRVQIVATGEWTMTDPRQKSFNPHVPRRRASMTPPPSDRKAYKARLA